MARVVVSEVNSVQIDGAGHYVALEAPIDLSVAMLDFFAGVDAM